MAINEIVERLKEVVAEYHVACEHCGTQQHIIINCLPYNKCSACEGESL